MRPRRTVILASAASVALVAASIAAVRDKAYAVTVDLSPGEPGVFYDFNVELLTHLGRPVTLDVTAAASNLARADGKYGWLLSSYFLEPKKPSDVPEAHGVLLRIPLAAITDVGGTEVRVRGTFRLSEIIDERQDQITLFLLPRG